MPGSKKNKHIITKIKEVAGIIAAITDIEFPEIARVDFYNLKKQLQVELQAPLRKLESKTSAISSKSIKDAIVGRVHSGLTSPVFKLTHSVKPTKKEWDEYFSTPSTDDLRIELVANLFFLLNLFEVKAINQFNSFELIESQLNANLEKLQLALTQKYPIQIFNEGHVVIRELRSWAELESFPKNDSLQIYLYQLDLFIHREVKQEIKKAFLTCMKKGNEGIKQMHGANFLHSALNRSMSASHSVQDVALQNSLLRSVSGEQAQAAVPVRPAPLPPTPPVAPPRRRRNPTFFPTATSNESNVTSSAEPGSSNLLRR